MGTATRVLDGFRGTGYVTIEQNVKPWVRCGFNTHRAELSLRSVAGRVEDHVAQIEVGIYRTSGESNRLREESASFAIGKPEALALLKELAKACGCVAAEREADFAMSQHLAESAPR